ncbi:MAG TPA: hypothetical protein VFD26_11240, partial [Methyloceanibacter sp.]|nr:hypothetical protein [Methyloceanibacter sp.]
MDAPTAGHLLRQIATRQQQADAARVADLAAAERTAVVAALERVSPRARVDVSVLIETVRTEVRARAEAEAARRQRDGGDVLAALNYQLSLISRGELADMRDE